MVVIIAEEVGVVQVQRAVMERAFVVAGGYCCFVGCIQRPHGGRCPVFLACVPETVIPDDADSVFLIDKKIGTGLYTLRRAVILGKPFTQPHAPPS